MVGRLLLSRGEPAFTLPAFERLAPAPPPELIDARIEAASAPGDIVADLFGRGGWVARAAIDRQRFGFSLESSPLTRLLAEVVLRPPDLRHLDAAFSALGASPLGESSLRLSINDTFASRCPTCGRTVALDEVEWEGGVPARLRYRCTLCRDQQGLPEERVVEPADADLARATRDVGAVETRQRLRDRFPVPEGGAGVVDALLDLHTDRQLVGLASILARIEGDLRAAPVESTLRLAFLHTVLPASRLGLGGPRMPALRVAGGEVRTAIPDRWRERNPWLAFEDGFRLVRAFVQRLESRAPGPLEARFGSDLRSLVESAPNALVRVMTPGALGVLAEEGRTEAGAGRIRLVLSQPPARFSQERLGAAYHGTAWALGREAAALLPLEPLLGPSIRAPWSWQATTLRRTLDAVAPSLAHDARVILLLEHGGREALVAAVLGGAGAGYRVLEARLHEPEDEVGGIVELVPPGGRLPPGPRSRSNVRIDVSEGGRGDPSVVAGSGLFAPPERIDARPFSTREAAATVLDTAVEVLRARGEPARYERLLGEILVGLDRSGALRRLMATDPGATEDATGSRTGGTAPPSDDTPSATASGSEARDPSVDPDDDPADRFDSGPGMLGSAGSSRPRASGYAARGGHRANSDRGAEASPPITRARTFAQAARPQDPVERVLAIVHEELNRSTQRRVVEVEPGRWWLADRRDREAAAIPLADRVEWAVFSLLSTAGPIAETAFLERVAALFPGHDLPDETLVRACLASYRSPASAPGRLQTDEDLRRRTAEHSELLARLANGGHRLGMRIWLGRREQSRRIGDRTLADFLDYREREPWFPAGATVAPEAGEAVDCIWYQRGGSALLFEVEWTAMLGDVVLRRHAGILPDERIVRFLVVAPERRELVRYKLETSAVLREAMDAANWHIVLWPHLRSWLDGVPSDLASLEPFLGLDPIAERRAEQLNLFEGGDALP